MVSRLEETTDARSGRGAGKAGREPCPNTQGPHPLHGALRQKEVKPIAAAFLAAGSHDPRLLEDAKRFYEAIIGELEVTGISSAFARVALCAVKGLVLSELLGTAKYTAKQRRAVIDELLRLVENEEVRV